jgi:HD-like signal output (HDOD) protein
MTDAPPPVDIENPQLSERDEGFVGSPLNRVFPCDLVVAKEASQKALTPELRVEEIAQTVLRDPVIVLELMRAANALLVRDGRPATTTVTGALIRLGSQLVHDTIKAVMERPQIEDLAVNKAFEIHRERGRKAGIVCRIIADLRAKKFSEDCHTVGVFCSLGEMLAALHLQQSYVQLQCLKNFFNINYRLSQDHHFDVERMRVLYLKRHGVPEDLVFAVDRDGTCKSKERAVLKPICFAAMELIEAFETDRWEKYAPGKTLSSKSTVKRLTLTDAQYAKLYERLTEYLNGKPAQISPLPIEAPQLEATQEPEAPITPEEIQLHVEHEEVATEPGTNEADTFLDELDEDELLPEKTAKENPDSDEDDLLNDDDDTLDDLDDDDDLDNDNLDDLSSAPREPTSKVVGPFCHLSTADLIAFRSPRGNDQPPHSAPTISPPSRQQPKSDEAIIESFRSLIDSATTTTEALSQVLNALVKTYDKDSLFSHSAIIVVSEDRKTAHVVATDGSPSDNETILSLEDPLSPLARCFSKVQSFGTRASASSPWNAKAFALSPISANHATPIALYADCGASGSISFQARRVFRKVVDILNQRLPSLPGEVPNDTTSGEKS